MTIGINKFQKDLKIKFKDRALLVRALTHKSATKSISSSWLYSFLLPNLVLPQIDDKLSYLTSCLQFLITRLQLPVQLDDPPGQVLHCAGLAKCT